MAFFNYKCGLQIPEFVKQTCRALLLKYILSWVPAVKLLMGKTKNTWSFENSSLVFAAKQDKKWKKLRVDVAHYHQRKSSFLSVLLLMFCVSHKRSVGLCHHMLEVVGIWFKCQNLTFWVFIPFANRYLIHLQAHIYEDI